ncbi:hypothetical protein GH714_001312 [Hevea brasiliensis]|uniref:Bulb-type lectin domain-containing protein n=1 Tax=Hevea brasiliensis TaxID=3981 RepID=A0A6A6LVN4_HEVBR|nr:hypothetical protein GH714_001312 [Hevea brasiliensis]
MTTNVQTQAKPLKDSSGVVKISDDGNLLVLNGKQEVLWSTHISNLAVNSSRAYLTDTGNFILQGDAAGSMWESFWQPSDTMVQAMGLDVNGKRGKGPQLTSSENPSDPSIGSSSVDCDANRIPEFFIWNDSKPLEKYSMERSEHYWIWNS